MRWIAFCLMVIMLSSVQVGLGQEESAPADGTAQASPTGPMVEPTPDPDFAPTEEPPPTTFQTGDWHQWQRMTGDWGGIRSQLADAGINFDISVTQILQGNAHGGRSTKNAFRYAGKADNTLIFDTGKMGLWPGGTILLNAEPRWGNGIDPKVGSLIPVNLLSAKPDVGKRCHYTLSEWFIQQVLLDGKIILLAGKLDGSRAFDTNVFANNERTQFLNAALRNNIMIPQFLPYTVLGAGVVWNPTPWLSVLSAIADSHGKPSTTGFNTAFHSPTGTTLINELAFKIKPFGLAGNQRVGFAWSSKDFQHLNPMSPFKETGPLLMKHAPKLLEKLAPYLPYDSAPDNVMVYYNFDQYVYTLEDDPTQGIGLFGRFGWARDDVNPVNYFYSIGMGGKGLIPNRANDTYGVGYFYADLSNELPPMFHSEQGVECYYNIEITPWLHISPDLQFIVNPGGTSANDVAIVYGMRVHMSL